MSDLGRLDLSGYSILELEGLQARVAEAIETRKAAKASELVESLRKEADAHGVSFQQVIKQAHQSANEDRRVLPAKYRNPRNRDETWSGRGKKPRWVVEALGQGKSLAELAIA